VVLQDTLLGNARAQLDLASARAKAGQVTELDVRRAEVQVGQQEVASLQARNTNEVDLLRLFQLLGVTQPERVLPVTNLPVTLPTDALAPLLDQALKTSPAATAQRLREDAAGRTLSAIRGSYLPTLNLSASVSGQTQKLAGVDTGGFPFGLNRQPYNLSAGLSFPVLNGFQREQNVAVASANRRDAEYNTRALELRLTADVTAAYRTLLADYQTVQIQLKNVVAARQALDLAEQRYRLGLASLVDLVQSRADYERAANDQINATYTFHRDYAALEGAVGRPLR
jgi:outer membrane protein